MKITSPGDPITEEEERKRLHFLLEALNCQRDPESRTWLVPMSRELWFINGSGSEKKFVGINYCPFCGFCPLDKKKWW